MLSSVVSFVVGTVLPIAWKFTLVTGVTTLVCFALVAILGGIAVTTENVVGAIFSFIFMTIPTLIMYVTGALFKVSLFVTVISFIIKIFV